MIEQTKTNNKLAADLQMWRRKCGIVQEKYQSLRSLFDKDKFIGRPLRQQEKQVKKYQYTTPYPFPKQQQPVSNVLQELNSMTNKLRAYSHNKSELRGIKKTLNFGDQLPEQDKQCPSYDRGLVSRYKWECISTIDAHSSPVLSIKSHKQMLISAATRSVKLWDL